MRADKSAGRVLWAAAALTVLAAGCSNDNPSNVSGGAFEGITETDVEGRILSLDPQDWTLVGVTIGEALFLEAEAIGFIVQAEGDTVEQALRALNFGATTLAVSASVPRSGFAVAPAETSLPSGADCEFALTYWQEGAEPFAGTLRFTAGAGREILELPVKGRIDDGVNDAVDFEVAFGPAYPNPFSNSCTIAFTMREAGEATVGIYTATNRRVRLLHQGQASAGPHPLVWDGLSDSGEALPPGIYAARFQGGGHVSWGDIELLR